MAVATKSAAELEPKLSKVTIFVPPTSRVAGLEVRCDGDKIGEFEWGVAMPRDGGGHDVEASAPGKVTWRTHVDLQESGGRVTAEVPVLDDAPLLTAGGKPSTLSLGAPASEPRPDSGLDGPLSSGQEATNTRRGQTQRVVGLTVGAAGMVGAGVGAVMALIAKSESNTAQGEHGELRANDAAGAVHLVNAATVVVVAGAVVAAAGALIWFTSPRAPAQLGTNGREFFLKGSF